MKNQITFKKVFVNNRWHTAIECWRVKYGKKGIEPRMREYQLFKGSPVGCIDEIVPMAMEFGVDGILLCDPIQNCTLFKFVGGGLWDLGIQGK